VDTTLYEFDPLEPGDPGTVGGYVLRARIGEGGMGRVYLSFTPGGRAVAVKLIRGELASDPEFRERFAREVSIAQQVNGIHIAQLIDSGTDRGVPWLASAYVAGPTLAQVISACGPLPPATVLALAGRIAESLGAIHATGMVHRDLKPGNILLDESGPKVIDFGIVRAATPTATGRSSHRTFIGSPPFMAPEQIRGRKITAATDVFALGATVYYLATGESAFQADFADGVLYRVMHDEPDYDACPEQVRELVRACLRKEPEERPTTQRIVDGCRAAGAGPETPLPDAVRALIQARAQALKMLANRPAAATATAAASAPNGEETEQETAPVPVPGAPTVIQTPLPTASTTAPGAPTEPVAAPDPHSAPTAAPARRPLRSPRPPWLPERRPRRPREAPSSPHDSPRFPSHCPRPPTRRRRPSPSPAARRPPSRAEAAGARSPSPPRAPWSPPSPR
jgi:serine/threonine protein kinase